MTPTPGNRIKEIREKLGLSFREAARRSGSITHGTIQNLERLPGKWDNVPLATLQAVARAYNLTLADVMRIAMDKTNEALVSEIEFPQAYRRIPLIYGVGAGTGDEDSYIVGTLETEMESPADVAYVVNGGSMEPEISEGCSVLVQRDVYSLGDLLVAYVPDVGLIVKRLAATHPDHQLILKSNIPDYGNLIAAGARIIGRVVEVRKYLIKSNNKQ